MFSDIITLDQLYDEIVDLIGIYSDTGKVTEDNVRRFALDKMRVFGNNVMVDYEDLIDITNHAGTLPDHLYRLNQIMMCDRCDERKIPEPCKDWSDEEIEALKKPKPSPYAQRLYKWVETNRYEESYNQCDPCNKDIETVVGCEAEFFPEVARIGICHPRYLSFGKGMIKGSCTDNCRRCHSPNSKYHVEIINNRQLRTSFPEATLYIQYYGLPLDDDGSPVIQNSQKGYLYEYLYYHVASKILELIIAIDTQAVALYREISAKAEGLFRKAMVDAKGTTFTVDAYINLHNRNRIYLEKFFKSRPHLKTQMYRNLVGIKPPKECGPGCYRFK